MKEEDLEAYFKFMEVFQQTFGLLEQPQLVVFVDAFITKFHKTQIRSNFL